MVRKTKEEQEEEQVKREKRDGEDGGCSEYIHAVIWGGRVLAVRENDTQ